MQTARSGHSVSVHYTGTLDDGSVFDSSEGRDPLRFKLGAGEVVPGFESNVTGMQVGETRAFRIPAAEAYGPRHDEMVFPVPRTHLPDDYQPEVGDALMMQMPDGSPLPVEVVEVSNDQIVLDANHPLAGLDLNFEVRLVTIDGPSLIIAP